MVQSSSLDLVKRKVIVVSNYEPLKEIMHDDKFEKLVGRGQQEAREIVKRMDFTIFEWHDENSLPSPRSLSTPYAQHTGVSGHARP